MDVKRIERKRAFIILGLLISLLGFTAYVSIISINIPTAIEEKTEITRERTDLRRPKASATYTANLTVDNADGSKNWAWAVTQAWCSGSGTPGDPYLINGHTVQFNNTLRMEYACINISNSRGVYFKISNCITRNNASDYGIGISLSNCSNGAIDTITASNNGDDGIYIINSQNITIDDSTMNSNHHYGLNMDNTTVSTITNTTMNFNNIGAVLSNSTYNLFQTTCQFNNNTNIGLSLQDSDQNNATSCWVYNNTNYGIEILNSDACYITSNNIEDNLDIGILIYDEGGNSQGNYLYSNDFDTNTNHNAMDNSTGTGNTWDNGVDTGNDWDDAFSAQGLTDLDDDGIADNPYNISGSASAQDRYPILNDGDDIAPAITIISPSSSAIYVSAPSFSLTIVEAVGIYNRWYSITWGSGNITFTGTTGTISASEWGRILGLPGEIKSVTLTFFVNDTTGNIGSATVSIFKYFLPLAETDKGNEEIFMYAFSKNQIYLIIAFAFALNLLLFRLMILPKKK